MYAQFCSSYVRGCTNERATAADISKAKARMPTVANVAQCRAHKRACTNPSEYIVLQNETILRKHHAKRISLKLCFVSGLEHLEKV